MAKLAKELLPALDHLELALRAAEEHGGGEFAKGIRQVQDELVGALGRVGIQPYSPKGEPFDPNEHEAMAQQPVEGAESGTVAEVYQQGYRINGDGPAARAGRRRRLGGPDGQRHRLLQGPRRRQARRPRRRSRRRTASSPASTTRTPTRSPGPRSASRRSPRPTTCSADPDKRKKYDRGGSLFGGANPFGGGGGGRRRPTARLRRLLRHPLRASSTRPAGAAARARGRRPSAGRDLETTVSLSFDQAVEGAQVPVSVATHAACPTCRGTGAEPGTSPIVCPVCHGRGVESEGQGLFSITRPCSRCGGSGTVIEHPCHTCQGQGRTRELKKYKVNIPAGVKEGSRIRLAGKGEAGLRGGPPGDLYVVTRVEESPVFQRKGDNFEVEVPITVTEAIRGADVEVPTLHGIEEAARAGRDEARHRPAAARRGPAGARRPRPRRHPLPLRDRRARRTSRPSRRRRSTASPRS